MILYSQSNKRMILKGTLNGKPTNFFLDTGASISILDTDTASKFGVKKKSRLQSIVSGIGGIEKDAWRPTKFTATVEGIPVYQFVLLSIPDVISSLKKSTGISVAGLIGLPQLREMEMTLVPNHHAVIHGALGHDDLFIDPFEDMNPKETIN